MNNFDFNFENGFLLGILSAIILSVFCILLIRLSRNRRSIKSKSEKDVSNFLTPVNCDIAVQMAKNYKTKMENPPPNKSEFEKASFEIDAEELRHIIDTTQGISSKTRLKYIAGVFGATENSNGYMHNCLILFPVDSNGNRIKNYSAGQYARGAHEIFPKIKYLSEMNDTEYDKLFNCN